MAKKATTSVEGTQVIWAFANGNNVVGDVASLPDEIKTQLALHGLRQKGSDAYAGDMSADDAQAATERVLGQLAAGEWTAARSGGGGPRVTMLAEALVRLAKAAGKDVSLEDAVATLEALDDDSDDEGVITKKSLRADPAVKKIMAEIRLERANKEAESNPSDVSSLFG